MEIYFCKNHPDRIARYRCYQCKQPICLDCRMTIRHHYFCSKRCYYHFLWDEFRRYVSRRKWIGLGVLQVLLLLIIVGEFFYFQHRLNHLSVTGEPAGAVADSVYLPALRDFLHQYSPEKMQFSVNATGNQQQNVYSLHLNVKQNWVVNIWKNGVPVVSRSVQKDTVSAFSLPLEEGENRFRLVVLDQEQHMVYRDEFHLTFHRPLMHLLGRSIEQGSSQHPLIAFTFDGGSDDAHTREILQILRDNHLHCTLFLTGRFMERHPELVQQMIADGHEIGNHTYDHPHLTTFAENHRQQTRDGVTRDFVQKELLKTDSTFFALTGQHLKPFWRAPFGEFNRRILQWAAEAGYLHIHWSPRFDTYDWVTDRSSRLYRTPEQVFRHFVHLDETRPHGLNGAIVLMHLGSHRDNQNIYETLPKLIQELRRRGYRLVTISKLLTTL